MAPKGDLADGAILFGQPSELDRLSAPNGTVNLSGRVSRI